MPLREIVPVPLPPSTVPLNRAVRFGNLVFVSGTAGGDVRSGAWGDIRQQAHKSLTTIATALESAGTNLGQVLAVTAYLQRTDDFDAYNEVYRSFFQSDFPTRTTIRADLMHPAMLVEISCIAGVPDSATVS